MLYFLPNRGICIYTISVVIMLITNNIKTGQAHIRFVWDERDYKKFELYANCLIAMITSLLISHGFCCVLDERGYSQHLQYCVYIIAFRLANFCVQNPLRATTVCVFFSQLM